MVSSLNPLTAFNTLILIQNMSSALECKAQLLAEHKLQLAQEWKEQEAH